MVTEPYCIQVTMVTVPYCTQVTMVTVHRLPWILYTGYMKKNLSYYWKNVHLHKSFNFPTLVSNSVWLITALAFVITYPNDFLIFIHALEQTPLSRFKCTYSVCLFSQFPSIPRFLVHDLYLVGAGMFDMLLVINKKLTLEMFIDVQEFMCIHVHVCKCHPIIVIIINESYS